MKRAVIALDVGTHRIGVAVSDDHRRMALPLKTVDARSRRKAVSEIADLIEDYDAGEVVVGWPLEMTGVEGRAVDRVRDLEEALRAEWKQRRREQMAIHRWDERLTTKAADRLLIDADMSRARRKETIDQVAACKILDAFLAHQSGEGG